MNAVEPKLAHEGGHLVVFAKNQPEYSPLPASVDAQGIVMTEWEPTAEELERLVIGGRVRIWLYGTEVQKGRPLTPMRVEAAEPECGFAVEHGPRLHRRES